jgi:hypothetical protein
LNTFLEPRLDEADTTGDDDDNGDAGIGAGVVVASICVEDGEDDDRSMLSDVCCDRWLRAASSSNDRR